MTPEQSFEKTRVVAIVRGVDGQLLRPLLEALWKGGIRLAEITLNTAAALASIREMRAAFDGRMHVGAGTVVDSDGLERALEAGAEFIVAPNTDPRVIETCRGRGILAFPGALTPTEIAEAVGCGSRYVKIFPAGFAGPRYFREVLGPFDRARLVAVGGVGPDNAADFMAAGAVGVGVGGGLCRPELLRAGDFAGVSRLASRLLSVCRPADGKE